MKRFLLLTTVAVLVRTTAWAQPHITSFKADGELTWTNFATVGAYRVEWAESLLGPWNQFDTQTNLNLILAETNRITLQVLLSNTPAFYRVAWLPPDPIGTWDYRGYDTNGTLVVTGILEIVSTTLASSNPPIYSISGMRHLGYAGTTNRIVDAFYLGTGEVTGALDLRSARLSLFWPPGCADCGMIPVGTLWPDTYSGNWSYETFVGLAAGGPFTATRRSE